MKKQTKQLMLILLSIFWISTHMYVYANNVDPQKIFTDFKTEFAIFKNTNLNFIHSSNVYHADYKISNDIRGRVYVFLLKNKPTLAITVKKAKLSSLFGSSDPTPIDILEFDNLIILYTKDEPAPGNTHYPASVRTELTSSMGPQASKITPKKGVNIFSKMKTQGAANDFLKILRLPLNSCLLEIHLRKKEYIIKYSGDLNNPFGTNGLIITNPTVKFNFGTTRTFSVFGDIKIRGNDYHIYYSNVFNKQKVCLGRSIVLNGKDLSLKSLWDFMGTIPGAKKIFHPFSICNNELPLEIVKISNPDYKKTIPFNIPDINKCLVAFATTKKVKTPDGNSGPRLVINGEGLINGHKLAHLEINCSRSKLNGSASVDNLHIGPISFGSADFEIKSEGSDAHMKLNEDISFSIGKYHLNKQAFSLDINKNSLSFSADAEVAGLGIGTLKGKASGHSFANAHFSLDFSIFGLSIGDVIDFGKNLAGMGSDALGEVVSISVGKSKLCEKFAVTATNSVLKGTESFFSETGKFAQNVGKAVVDFVGGLFGSGGDSDDDAPSKPLINNVFYYGTWVHDYASYYGKKKRLPWNVHPCKISISMTQGSHHYLGPCLRYHKGNYNNAPIFKINYPAKGIFDSKEVLNPFWEINLGQDVKVGAIIINAGSEIPAFADHATGTHNRKNDLEKNGISGAIVAISRTVHGNELMKQNHSNVKYFYIPQGKEMVIIRPMAGTQEHNRVKVRIEELINRIHRSGFSVQEAKRYINEMRALNKKVVEKTPEIRYIRIFKVGKSRLKLENVSVIEAKDAPYIPYTYK